jgi:hypothetical protein
MNDAAKVVVDADATSAAQRSRRFIRESPRRRCCGLFANSDRLSQVV